MSIQNLFNQFLGSAGETSPSSPGQSSGIVQGVSNLSSKIPGGLVGGAAAGGIVALLVGNKSARKFAGKAATYGGAAMLGGLAFKAFQNYRSNTGAQPAPPETLSQPSQQAFHQHAISSVQNQQDSFELILMKAMIAAARADGHIDNQEQQRIFQAVQKMDLSATDKGLLFDLMQQDICVEELAASTSSIELKAEIYLASCLVIEPDHASEREYLDRLVRALELPDELAFQLEHQAQQVISVAA
jgi:uncharacterized membrane protein YebE (DUF533 family)